MTKKKMFVWRHFEATTLPKLRSLADSLAPKNKATWSCPGCMNEYHGASGLLRHIRRCKHCQRAG